MLYKELEPLLIRGKVGLLPNYEGYFHWNWGTNQPYMLNGDYIKYNLAEEMKRDDWYYII